MQINNQIASRRWRSRSANSNHITGGTARTAAPQRKSPGLVQSGDRGFSLSLYHRARRSTENLNDNGMRALRQQRHFRNSFECCIYASVQARSFQEAIAVAGGHPRLDCAPVAIDRERYL